MSTRTMKRKPGGQNGTPASLAPDRTPYDQWQTKLLETAISADERLARRVKEHEALAPLVQGLIRTLASLADAGQIDDVKLEYLEPGEYGDDEVYFPQRIQFTWNVIGYDKRYSNADDFSITLMGAS